MRRFTILVVLVAFIFSCGGQWYVLQVVAWGNMIRDYSQMVSLGEAVSMTFSGQYPCPICKTIQEKKQSENNNLCAIEKYEKKFFPPLAIGVMQPQPMQVEYPNLVQAFTGHSEAPPTPPPRFA